MSLQRSENTFNVWYDIRLLNIISASVSNLLMYLVVVDTYCENPVSHRLVVAKGLTSELLLQVWGMQFEHLSKTCSGVNL